ncbi:MAG: DUF5117 domain-containing protein, partial [Proteobacteria bacterium]|nr:DUF5117 domain-containing protein [Pseudomonadota bacterium]
MRLHLEKLDDRQTVTSLLQDVDKMSRMVEQLLAAAKMESGAGQIDNRIDLNEICVEVGTDMGPLAIKAGRTIEVLSPEAPVLIKGNRFALEQAVRNLVENSLKYAARETKVVIEVTELYSTDVPVLGLQQSRRETYGVRRLDTDRSFVQSAKSFPQNIEVRSVLTYEATKAPSNASTGTVSLEMNHSMIMLPADPMQPRLWDDRTGFFSLTQNDYGRDEQRAVTRRYITRWRLEPSDPAAWARGELVDPVKPIEYYINPATPEKWRPYLK